MPINFENICNSNTIVSLILVCSRFYTLPKGICVNEEQHKFLYLLNSRQIFLQSCNRLVQNLKTGKTKRGINIKLDSEKHTLQYYK